MNTGQIRSISSNYAFLLSADVITALMRLVATVIAANGLGAAGFGLLAVALAFAEIFFAVSDMGLDQWSVREMARRGDRGCGIFHALFNAKGILSVLVFASFSSIALLLYGLEAYLALFIFFSLGAGIDAFTLISYSVFQATSKMGYLASARTILTGVYLLGVWLAVGFGYGIVGVAVVYLLSRISGFLFGFGMIRIKRLAPSITEEQPSISFVFKSGFPFAVFVIVATLVPRSDFIMLSMMFPLQPEIVGWFSAAARLVLMTHLIAGSFLTVLYPLMARIAIENRDAFRESATRIARLLLMVGGLMTILVFFLAEPIISFLYSPEYVNSGSILGLLGLSIFVTFLRMSYEWNLNASDNQGLVLRSNIIRLTINICLNLLALSYGFIAVVWATIAAEMIGGLLSGCYSVKSRIIDAKQEARDSLAVGVVSAFTVIAAIGLLPTLRSLQPLYAICIGFIGIAGIYGVLSYYAVLTKEDRGVFRGLLRSGTEQEIRSET